MNVAIDESTLPDTIGFLLSPAGDEALAYYAIAACLPCHSFPDDLGVSFDQIELCLRESPLLRVRLCYLRQRMVAIARLHDPVVQFEQLVGV